MQETPILLIMRENLWVQDMTLSDMSLMMDFLVISGLLHTSLIFVTPFKF